MTLYLVEAEHFSVPGRILALFNSETDAVAEAVSLTNIMLRGSGRADCVPEQWERAVDSLQDEHGAQHCYVTIHAMEPR